MKKKDYENIKRIKALVEQGTASFAERNILKIYEKRKNKKLKENLK